MRVYKFLDQEFGLKTIREKRLKQSRLDDLNDPYELTPYDLTDAGLRQTFLKTREEMSQERGMACFSSSWGDPVIWAHYSDKHRGLCLGFEIPPEVEKAQTREVNYISAPLPFPADFRLLGTQQQLAMVKKMILTKYRNWEYEHEIRTWTDLEEEFFNFCEVLQLVEVIIGAGSTLPAGEITRALGSTADQVTVKKARAAHDKFEMVADEEFI